MVCGMGLGALGQNPAASFPPVCRLTLLPPPTSKNWASDLRNNRIGHGAARTNRPQGEGQHTLSLARNQRRDCETTCLLTVVCCCCLSLCLCLCLSLRLFACLCLSLCVLSTCLSVYLSICRPVSVRLCLVCFFVLMINV